MGTTDGAHDTRATDGCKCRHCNACGTHDDAWGNSYCRECYEEMLHWLDEPVDSDRATVRAPGGEVAA